MQLFHLLITSIMMTESRDMELPAQKKRKVHVILSTRTVVGTEIRSNGTMTPSELLNETPDDKMDLEVTPSDCPCGYMHGPGENHNHDVSAVGFSANVMRGPD